MTLTAKQKVQRWWLQQKKHDLLHLRTEIDVELGKIDHALMLAPQAPSHVRNIKDKYNHEPRALALVDNTETF